MPLLVGLAIILATTFICLAVGLDFVSLETLTSVGLFSSLVSEHQNICCEIVIVHWLVLV